MGLGHQHCNSTTSSTSTSRPRSSNDNKERRYQSNNTDTPSTSTTTSASTSTSSTSTSSTSKSSTTKTQASPVFLSEKMVKVIREDEVLAGPDGMAPFTALGFRGLHRLLELDNEAQVMEFYNIQRLSKKSKSSKFHNLVINALKKHKASSKSIEEVYMNYHKLVEPTDTDTDKRFVYNTLMSHYAAEGNVKRVEELFAAIAPDNFSYTNLINTYANAGAMDKVLETLAKAHKESMVDSTTYNELIKRIAINGQFQMCLAIIDEMRRQGTEFDIVSYHTLFMPFAQEKTGQCLVYLLKEFQKTDLPLDGKLFSAIIESFSVAYERLGDPALAQLAIDFFKQTPNAFYIMKSVTLTHMLTMMPLDQVEDFWDRAWVECPRYITPAAATCYAKILLKMDNVSERMMKLFNIAKDKFFHNAETQDIFYNFMIKALLMDGRVAEAWSIFNYLLRNNRINSPIYFTVVKFLCQHSSDSNSANSCREIIVSPQFNNVVNERRDWFWKSILSELVKENNYNNLITSLYLIKSTTDMNMSIFHETVYDYLHQRDPKVANQLFTQ
ncbi:hypothetical protein SAMD00019534_116130 [Acytostelium subglobosum LB1]|uniref:hypothetical protein n=1 Tax=Acytostelium subglobosum LB1 TaxID=1410327 RepID=UPI000644851D|nr:hypothetical protein SAMD00019534_116130 [Acytostelium subglobosum LB1]GAM28437.1 hypothetical protein SAMD00019534_116130 [Acytostelium subglobosum LB1]|eukprot:XP_012748754.1 hypothetical protein SAMD00019534_116130 [Acytostelium subglobosum LB1]